MLSSGPAKKLTIYIDESAKYHGKPAYEVILHIFLKKRLPIANAFRGIEGYGSDGVFHTAKILELSTSLPVKIEALGPEDLIKEVLPEVMAVAGTGLIEISDTVVLARGSA